ncbi:TPA: lipid-A-disaccharide synthase, partial [archaeon]|nr:lipid-A-disaccharide synthase [Candidatus Naiadarchaeales archaeon SRR2090159.bin1288]
MGRVWIDILTPKQVMMFGRLADEISGEHELLITTREYKET